MKIFKNKELIRGRLLALALIPFLTSCATYNSGFTCSDPIGVPCTSMERVDQMISSGEIEAYLDKRKKCKRGSCRRGKESDAIRAALSN